MGHQRREGSGDTVYPVIRSLLVSNNKRHFKMGAKIGWLIVDWLCIPLSLLGIYLNMDNLKSGIIAILAIIYLMMRTYFYFVQKRQAVREKDLELWHLEQDKIDRMNKNKSK